MRRRPTTSSRLHFIALFSFWCLDDKGGEECYTIRIFHSMCLVIWTRIYLICDLLYFKMACKTYYAYLISIYDLDDYSCLSIYVVYF
jgi:hypothetical protein